MFRMCSPSWDYATGCKRSYSPTRAASSNQGNIGSRVPGEVILISFALLFH